ncbi:hypothetical protein N9X64_00215 [bacterium]|nr:hypothetical protein [bacterium]
MSNYSSIPERENSRTAEISSVKLLQDEQIRLTLLETKMLMYYISGGNVDPEVEVADVVRDEDQDLRGWFSGNYGEDYIEFLTSDASATLRSSEGIAKIKAAFNENDLGYTMRVGALNDYHLGRIITHAAAVNKHRNQALQHSARLVEVCATLILEGQIPPPDLFTTLHSSITNWYRLKDIEVTLYMDKHLAAPKLTDDTTLLNHTSYISHVVMALFDIHKASANPKHWHDYEVPNAADLGITTSDIEAILGALDGTTEITKLAIGREYANAVEPLNKALKDMKAKGWDVQPTITAEVNKGFELIANSVFTEAEVRALYEVEAQKPIGDPLPPNRSYKVIGDSRFVKSSIFKNTNDLLINYTRYKEVEAKVRSLTHQALQKQLRLDNQPPDTSAYHMTPAAVIFSSIPAQEAGVMVDAKVKWIKYIYARVKKAYGLNYYTKALELGANSYSPFPALRIPITFGQNPPVDDLNYIDVSKLIQFYGQAYLAGTPTGYWSKNLAYRVFIRKNEGNSKTIAHSEIYLYDANIRTGGIFNGNVIIGKATAEVETTKGLIGGFLPDIPLYNPGTNPQLTTALKESFSHKVENTPSLQSWLNNGNKDPFHYAYAIRSSWDPLHGSKIKKRWSTYLLGGVPRKWWEPISAENPAIGNTHMDWLRANKWSNSNFKGITVFSPSLKTLRYDPIGNYQNSPEFYEAKGTIASTEMKCVAFPKAAAQKVVEFMNSVPAKLSAILNSVTNETNSAWSGTTHDFLNNWHNMGMANGWTAAESDWPEIPRKQYARAPGSRAAPRYFYDKATLRDLLRPMGTFLENSTEALFIKDPRTVMTKAYNRLITTKPALGERPISANYPGGGLPSLLLENDTEGSHLYRYTQCFDEKDFGEYYSDYMALLGAISYFNSYHLLTDVHKTGRTYPDWCKPFTGKVTAIVDSVLGSYTGTTIYSSQINDTEDVSTMHRVLKDLGAFSEMTEMPVFDVPEFHVKWIHRSPNETKVVDSPFINGYPMVPVGGLEAQVFSGLNKTYGDVFYNTILNSAILQPVFKQPIANYYMYSSLRVPVSTTGVSSKTYGMRPGASYSFDTVSNTQSLLDNLRSGSGGLSHTGLVGVTGIAFLGLLGVSMYKSINNEGAFADVRWKSD